MPRGPGRTGRPWLRLRAQVIAAATHCEACHQPLWPQSPRNHRLETTVDHRLALVEGGHPTDPSNLAVLHRGCNSRKENARRRSGSLGTSRNW